MATSSPLQFEAQQQAARLSLGANLFLVAIKVGAGFQSGSLSVLAEGIQSLLDVFASAMILYVVKAAAAPPDEAHPYGHGKFENLMALMQMALVLGSIGGIWWAAWHRLQDPVMPRIDAGIAALLVAIAVNLWVSGRVFRVADATGSAALRAEGVHLRGDLWSCAGVLGGLTATHLFQNARLDPLFAAIMTVFSFSAALHLLRDTLRPLLDESLPGAEELQIRAVLEAEPRVLGFHKLRTRQAGSVRLADVHILLDDHLSFRAAHDIGEQIEDEIRRVLPNLDVMVHTEPFEAETRHQNEAHGAVEWRKIGD